MIVIICFFILGSPIGSVQDISPPSTPSNSTISSLSPFINSLSTGNNVTSPQLFTNSSGPYSASQTNITSPYLSSPLSSRTYQNKYPYGDGKILPGTPNSHGSLGSSIGVHSTPQSSCISPVVATSAAALHPLQQAMLLQKQQIVVCCIHFILLFFKIQILLLSIKCQYISKLNWNCLFTLRSKK